MQFPRVRGLQFNQLKSAARLTVPGALAVDAERYQRGNAERLVQAAQAVSGKLAARTQPMGSSPYARVLRTAAFPLDTGIGDSSWEGVLQNFVGQVGTGIVGKVLGRAPAPVTNVNYATPASKAEGMSTTTKVLIGAAIAVPVLFLVLRK